MHSKSFVVVNNGIITSKFSHSEKAFKDIKMFFEYLLTVFEGKSECFNGNSYCRVELILHPDRDDFIKDTEFTIDKYGPEYTVSYSRDKILKHTVIMDDLQEACNFLLQNVLFVNPNENEYVEFIETKEIGEQLPLDLSA